MTEAALNGYTDEKNIQILIALMKHHGIRQVVVSPGATNVTFVASIQQDPFFLSILLLTSDLLPILPVVLLLNRASQ